MDPSTTKPEQVRVFLCKRCLTYTSPTTPGDPDFEGATIECSCGSIADFEPKAPQPFDHTGGFAGADSAFFCAPCHLIFSRQEAESHGPFNLGPGWISCPKCKRPSSNYVGPKPFNPPPKPGVAPATWDLVVADMKARDAAGAAKHGVRHQHDNGRDHLRDAYEEALDLTCYLRGEIEARKTKKEG